MLKNILKLDGAQQLSKNEQKEINGGLPVNYGCSAGGVRKSINSCLCNGGSYSAELGRCVSGTSTNNFYENATGCCYTPFNGEF